MQKNTPRQQSLYEQTKENWIQVIFKRRVEGYQQTREDIDDEQDSGGRDERANEQSTGHT